MDIEPGIDNNVIITFAFEIKSWISFISEEKEESKLKYDKGKKPTSDCKLLLFPDFSQSW